MKFFTLTFCLLVSFQTLFAQSDTVKFYTTKRLEGEAPKIDGHSNDAAWEQVPWGGGDFIQRQPAAGTAPSAQTKFKVLYDARNLYILFLNLDPEPDKIVRRMSRRDGFEGDFVEVNIDSYFDKRTAFSFTASVSGVKGDEYVSNNGNNWDANWDPIWYLQTSITSEGWIAEMRIPLSQLRFADKPVHTWGMQVTRMFFRNQERSLWQYFPPEAPGWVHRFAELRGIEGIRPQKQLEVQPYIVAKTERFEPEQGNPFATGKSSGVDMGVDAKIGITSDITLDLTVNPDFGQVEADPSQVNLTAFRLFFQERRPFFIEGNNILNFPIADFNNNNLFYSRRIGRTPQGSPDTDEHGEDDVDEYVKTNNMTTILGAAKITGKNKKGFSWGLLESVTSLERVKIDSLGESRHQVVEPMTNYLVARAQQDINEGNTVIGGMLTATNREIDDARLNWLHTNAYTGGLDFIHNWKERKYFITFRGVASRVSGSTEAILNTQQASERYFQRPDNNHAAVDSSRTSLTGTGGMIMFAKRSGKFVYEVGGQWLSPELELNDIGFLTQTDIMSQWSWCQYRILSPIGKFRWLRFNLVQFTDWDFDRKIIGRGYFTENYVQFKNFWGLSSGGSYNPRNVSNADLRGGPAMHYPANYDYWIWIGSDERKKFRFYLNTRWQWAANNFMRSRSIDLQMTYQPINALNISISPSFTDSRNAMQYVTTGSSNNEDRFVVAEIDQTIFRVSLRMTYMITPNLSVQYWGQPFGTSGKYSGFKFITDADAPSYGNRFWSVPAGSMTLSDDYYRVDENNDGTPEFDFEKPDFNFGQFRSNMVVRWEYIPGSTFFLVWTQERNGAFYDKDYNFKFDEKGHNIFLMKFTYRFIL